MQRMFDENRTKLETERKERLNCSHTLRNCFSLFVLLKTLKRCVQLVQYSIYFPNGGKELNVDSKVAANS